MRAHTAALHFIMNRYKRKLTLIYGEREAMTSHNSFGGTRTYKERERTYRKLVLFPSFGELNQLPNKQFEIDPEMRNCNYTASQPS